MTIAIFKKDITMQKLLSGVILTSILLSSFTFFLIPKKAEAIGVDGGIVVSALAPLLTVIAANTGITAGTTGISSANSVKDWALLIAKEVAMRLARNMINRMTQATINWINSGFHGNPLYVENPKSFFNDIAKTEVRYMVDLFGYDRVRYPYGRDFAQNVINQYQSQLATNAEYSLNRVINNPALLEGYRTDFNVGGWSGFLVNTQYPQNNYVGFNMIATEELARRLDGTSQTAAQKVQAALQQGQGFLSPQICPSNPAYNNLRNEFQRPTFQPTTPYSPPSRESYSSDDAWGNAMLAYEAQNSEFVAAERAVWAQTNTCPEGLVATTPGSVVANQIMTAMSSKYRQGELSAAMGNSLSAIFDALLNRFFDSVTGGLRGLNNRPVENDDSNNLSGTINGGPTTTPGGEGGGGGCIAYISQATYGFRSDVVAAIDRALNADSALANSPATNENAQRMRDLVVSQLRQVGLDASASYNGNCNLSPNGLGVRSNSAPVGELYDVVRDDPSMTVRSASTTIGRPIYNGNASWNFIVNGRGSTETTPEAPLTP